MNIVLTMAGKYSRFRLFGNKIPKYLLPLGTGTILIEIIRAIATSADNPIFYLIGNRNDQMFHPIIKSILGANGIPTRNLTYIDDTSSQLETALYAMDVVESNVFDEPIAFANIDTVIYKRNAFFSRLECLNSDDGLLDVFKASNKQYSYILENEQNSVDHVVDKTVVSQNACSGLYGFGSFRTMMKEAEALLDKKGGANFTDLYNHYIRIGKRVYMEKSNAPSDTCVMGTPEEYVINIHRFK